MKVIDCNQCFIIGEKGSFIVTEKWVNPIESQTNFYGDGPITIDGVTFTESDSYVTDYNSYIKEKFIQTVIDPRIDKNQ